MKSDQNHCSDNDEGDKDKWQMCQGHIVFFLISLAGVVSPLDCLFSKQDSDRLCSSFFVCWKDEYSMLLVDIDNDYQDMKRENDLISNVMFRI